mmetsp:Transcript_72547/g.210042  ORF Transcript_72547/g.210042 Transcript_72547/m.210042 type:complete len:241 (+) Transcript_72547:1041-1763(+)
MWKNHSAFSPFGSIVVVVVVVAVVVVEVLVMMELSHCTAFTDSVGGATPLAEKATLLPSSAPALGRTANPKLSTPSTHACTASVTSSARGPFSTSSANATGTSWASTPGVTPSPLSSSKVVEVSHSCTILYTSTLPPPETTFRFRKALSIFDSGGILPMASSTIPLKRKIAWLLCVASPALTVATPVCSASPGFSSVIMKPSYSWKPSLNVWSTFNTLGCLQHQHLPQAGSTDSTPYTYK